MRAGELAAKMRLLRASGEAGRWHSLVLANDGLILAALDVAEDAREWIDAPPLGIAVHIRANDCQDAVERLRKAETPEGGRE